LSAHATESAQCLVWSKNNRVNFNPLKIKPLKRTITIMENFPNTSNLIPKNIKQLSPAPSLHLQPWRKAKITFACERGCL
ncbi:hypothetical protein CDAR_504551, partial [Caerostris darwini]